VADPIPVPPSLAERPARVLAYRVNRRPIGAGTLLPETMPEDSFDHFVRVLAPGYEVITAGRGHERSWRAGAIEVGEADLFVTGKLGWYRREPEVVPSWSAELKDWLATLSTPPETLMPFAYDGEKRVLGVVHDRKSSPKTIAAVFEQILDENERELPHRTTEWSVEPILDSEQFIEWLGSVDILESVAFTAKLPNPEPRSAFEDLTGRMENTHATEYSARMKTSREEGLQHIVEDPEFSQAIAMGQQGFAELEGRGRRDDHRTVYRQGDKVASETIPRLPGNWTELRGVLKQVVRHRLRRFLLDEDEAA
jgi:hypothetical protein